jgi:hypothetical protein
MVNPEVVLAALRKLARAIPTFAPNLDDQETAQIWCAELSDLSLDEIATACRRAVRKCDKFPSLARLRKMGRPEKIDDPRLLAESIWTQLNTNSSRPQLARQAIGEVGWLVVERAGGWDHLRWNADTNNETIHKAQLRGIADAVLSQIEAGVQPRPALPSTPSERHLRLVAVGVDEVLGVAMGSAATTLPRP